MKKYIVLAIILVSVLGIKANAKIVVDDNNCCLSDTGDTTTTTITTGGTRGGGGPLIELAKQKAQKERIEKLLAIKFGSKGQEVKDLQTYLNSKGASLKVDGIFGKLTLKAFNQYK